jgi:hypothetical protein
MKEDHMALTLVAGALATLVSALVLARRAAARRSDRS